GAATGRGRIGRRAAPNRGVHPVARNEARRPARAAAQRELNRSRASIAPASAPEALRRGLAEAFSEGGSEPRERSRAWGLQRELCPFDTETANVGWSGRSPGSRRPAARLPDTRRQRPSMTPGGDGTAARSARGGTRS